MAAPSPVLYALHNSVEPRGFENLCVDLLIREGHSRIIPGGRSRDHGRDAEVRHWTDSKKLPLTAFQFSMEYKWEPKLRNDISKILQHGESINRIVFVSNRSITVEKQDRLREEFLTSHQIDLEIFDEGWFRVRLEEEHADLALKHLGVSVPVTPGFHATRIKIHGLTDENQEEMLRHTSAEKLRAILTAQTKADPTNSDAWSALAYICDHMLDYKHALFCVSKALKCTKDEVQRFNLNALKASIIAEQGIASESRLLLKKAEEQFLAIIFKLGRSVDYYNLANVQGALGKRAVAELHYRRCLEIDPNYAQSWNNLGSLLVKMRREHEGIACFDRALQLKPDMLEAMISKANVLVMFSNDCTEALQLMERAFVIDPDLEKRWPHVHYWQALALCRQEQLAEALMIVEDRLERKFDCPYLGRLATDILAKLWRSDPNYIAKAENFFRMRIDPEERDYRVLGEILDLLDVSEREDQAWHLLEEFLGIEELSIKLIASRIPLSISDLTNSLASLGYYRRFRDASNLADYARIFCDCGLRPHNDVPGILFHLLLPAYFELAAVLQNSCPQSDSDEELKVILNTYRLVSRIFAAFGGALLAPSAPESMEKRAGLVARAVLVGQDIPLMELSRLLGFLYGVADREVPERYREATVEATSSVHENWLKSFFEAVGFDWKIESWSK